MSQRPIAALKTLTKYEIKCELAKRSFLHFLDFVYITQPSLDSKGGERIKFEKWPHLVDAAAHLESDRLLVVPKPRQIGWSWVLAAWAAFCTLFNPNFKTLLFSQGKDEAYDLLSKCTYIWANLPPELQTPRTNDGRQALEFGPEWWIRAFPSTIKAGHGNTAGLVIFDEADFHEYLEEAYAAVKPTVDDLGGQLIMVSKCNGMTPMSFFKEKARGAPDNGFTCLFYPYNVRPNRDEQWYNETLATYKDIYDFRKNYPRTLEEALEPPQEMQVITKELIKAYRGEARDPVLADGITKVWQHYVPGRKYIAGTDVSHGVGLDKSVTAIIDLATGAVIADVVSRSVEPLQFTVESLALLRKYGQPVWVIEDNDWGRRVIDRALALDYPRVFYRSKLDAGYRTNDATRPIVWGNLVDSLLHRTLIIPNMEAVDEMASLVRNPARRGRIEAAQGSTDDYLTALGLALTCKDHAVKGDMPYDPSKLHGHETSTYKWGRRRR